MFLEGVAPYFLSPSKKAEFLSRELSELVAHHRAHCPAYARMTDDRFSRGEICKVDDLPYLPVSLFKEYDLRSTAEGGVSVRSSATTTGNSSVVFVDKQTRKRQTISASKLWTDYLGPQRRPYLVFDEESTVRGSASMSARGAAILSLAPLATELFFVAKSDGDRLQVDFDALNQAMTKIGEQPFLAYGFTFILYQLHQELAKAGWQASKIHPESVLMHSGGWKRLVDLAVDKATFNRNVADVWRLPAGNVIDFYGTVEQVGMVYPDCAEGNKHVPYWAEVVLRSADTLEPVRPGETGLIQLLSCLPLSAPNHSVLTEDLGELVTEDGCACGRRGRAFRFKGRAPRSEVRGCSDVTRG